MGMPWKILWMVGWMSRYTNMSDGKVIAVLEELERSAVGNGHIVETRLHSETWLRVSMFAQAVDTL
jgi:hypothetical protein